MTDLHCTSSIHQSDTHPSVHMPSANGGGSEEHIVAIGHPMAALQRQLDGAIADLCQAKRRAAVDLALAARYGHQDFAQALLSFKDALEAALVVRTGDVAALRDGLVLARRQLDAALERRHG